MDHRPIQSLFTIKKQSWYLPSMLYKLLKKQLQIIIKVSSILVSSDPQTRCCRGCSITSVTNLFIHLFRIFKTLSIPNYRADFVFTGSPWPLESYTHLVFFMLKLILYFHHGKLCQLLFLPLFPLSKVGKSSLVCSVR